MNFVSLKVNGVCLRNLLKCLFHLVGIGVLGVLLGCLMDLACVFDAASLLAKILVASKQAGIFGWLFAAGSVFFIRKLNRADVRFNRPFFLSAVLTGTALVLGALYNSGLSLELVCGLWRRCCFLAILLMIAVAYIYLLLCMVAKNLRIHRAPLNRSFVLQKRGLMIAFALLTASWLPYVLIFAPGTVSWDMSIQLSQYFGADAWSSHHPLASSLAYGFLYNVGTAAGDGTLFVCVVQLLALSLSCLFEIYIVQLLMPNRVFVVASLVFFCLCPIFGMYCQWLVKDTLFGICFIVFNSLFVFAAVRPEIFRKRSIYVIGLLIFSILVCLLRNNGIYPVAMGIGALLIISRKDWPKWVLCVVALGVIVAPLINESLLIGLDASRGSKKEMLSLPFQQTARYAFVHGAEATIEEKKEVEDCLGSYDELGEFYDPVIADPIKERYTGEGELGYFKAWISQGLKHPLTYIDALCEGTYGYWSIVGCPSYFKFDQQLAMLDRDPRDYQQDYYVSDTIRSKISDEIKDIRSTPPLGFPLQVGFYTLLLVCLIGLAWGMKRADKRLFVAMVPSLILFLTCLASPLNGSIRYAFGLIATMPVLLSALMAYVIGRE